MVKSKVIVLPEVQLSLSREGLPLVMLDWPADLEEALTSPEVGGHWVVYRSSQGEGSHPNPMWYPMDWMKQKVMGITEEDVPWWHLVMLMMDGGVEHTLGLAKYL